MQNYFYKKRFYPHFWTRYILKHIFILFLHLLCTSTKKKPCRLRDRASKDLLFTQRLCFEDQLFYFRLNQAFRPGYSATSSSSSSMRSS